MDTLIIQTGIKHGRVAELTRSHDNGLSIGRAYDNDLVITDHHVAPHQVHFFREGDRWHIRVLDSTNPVFLNDTQVMHESPPIKVGDHVTVGRTRLTICSSDQRVEKTHKLVMANWLARDSLGVLVPALCFLGACVLAMVLAFFEGSTTLDWAETAYDQILAAVLVIVWAGAWALVGRVVRHQSHFGLQLITTSTAMLLSTLLYFAARYAAYPFHDVRVSEAFGWVALFALLCLLFYFNLVIATNVLRARTTSMFASLMVVAVVFGFNWSSEPETDEDGLYPEFSRTLAPSIRQGQGEEPDRYFRALESRIKAEASDPP